MVDWDVSKITGTKVRVFRVKEVVFDKGDVQFPMRAVADAQLRAIVKPKPNLSIVEVCVGEDEKASGESIGIRSKTAKAVADMSEVIDVAESKSIASPDDVDPITFLLAQALALHQDDSGNLASEEGG